MTVSPPGAARIGRTPYGTSTPSPPGTLRRVTSRWLSPRRLIVALVAVLAVAIVAQIVNANVASDLSDADKYGSVHLPGSAILELPAGSLEVMVHGDGSTALDVPRGLRLTVVPVGAGLPTPVLTRDRGGQFGLSGRSGSDEFRRIWRLHTPRAGAYRVTVSGVDSAGDTRELTFGHGPPASAVEIWEIAGIVMLAVLLAWTAARLAARARAAAADRR
jgi:hypothetical protein